MEFKCELLGLNYEGIMLDYMLNYFDINSFNCDNPSCIECP